jgi:RNA polymerase sigma-70 factor (ECF subfamily)
MDAESAAWVRALQEAGAAGEVSMRRLHALLVRVARAEVSRRGPHSHISGPELDDLAVQAASDASLAIGRKIAEFRGESRFTTWACKFVIFEVASKLARHWSRRPTVALDGEGWERLPARFGFDPVEEAESRELLAAVRRAIDGALTPRQRRVFIAIVVKGVPLDVLAAELGSTRNAIYKTMFDTRRKLRASLEANGYLSAKMSRDR